MNNVTIEKLEKNQVKLTVKVPSEKFEEGMNKAFFKNAKYFNIPGFRKGKAPRNIIERTYGENVFYEEAFNEVATIAYDVALQENKIKAVGQPKVDITQIGKGKELIFTAIVDVWPEVEIKDYKGIEIEKKEYNVEGKDVEHQIEHMAEKNARLLTVEDREAKEKDIVTIDFEGFQDGKAFEGGKGTNHELELGSHTFIAGFEEQVVGMKIGEEKEINVTFPEEYFSKELAGKPATFKVVLHSIKMKELPKIDDEFAKDVSEFDTLKDLKKDIKEKLEKNLKQKQEDDMYDELAKKLVESAKMDIPKSMIDSQMEKLIRDFEWEIKYKGMELDTYLGYLNMTKENFREQFRPQATKTVSLEVVLDEIAKKEKIEVTEEELENKIDELARSYSSDEEEIKEVKSKITEINREDIKGKIRFEKTLKWLLENATIVKK